MITSLSTRFARTLKDILPTLGVPVESIQTTLTPSYNPSEDATLKTFVVPVASTIETSTRTDFKQTLTCDIVVQKYIGCNDLDACDEYINLLEATALALKKLATITLYDGSVTYSIDEVDVIAIVDGEQLERSYIYSGQLSITASVIGTL